MSLDQVAEKFKQNQTRVKFEICKKKMHAELEQLVASEKQLEREIDTLPGELDVFNVEINEVAKWLNYCVVITGDDIKTQVNIILTPRQPGQSGSSRRCVGAG